jgi:hypothetical protein
MVWSKHLLTSLLYVAVIGLLFVGVVPASAAECNTSDWLAGNCNITVGNDGHEVTIGGEVDVPGKGAGDPGSGEGADPSPDPAPPGPTVDRPDYTVTMPVTLSDLATFRPDPGTDHMQPDGWMIVGLSTNFYAHVTRQVKTGMLLGEPASVRFTPVRYAWTYGDGASRTASTPGGTWKSLGLHEFDPTATSHVYRDPGRYSIDLTIGFAPEYRYADGTEWIPVAGLVWVPANRLVAVAASGAKTVLVEDECTINPFGPGC